MPRRDARSVGELLHDTDRLSRELLWDVRGDDAASLVRTWGEVVEAAAELWAAIPTVRSAGAGTNPMDRLETLARAKLDIHLRVSEPTGKPRSLVPPKMAKRRTTIYPEISPTGYPLAQMMRQRVTEALGERSAGLNPKGLLFPSSTGDWWWTGNFHRDLFERAALSAGWKFTDELRPYAGGMRLERNWELTWHSLRHTFCTVALEEWKLPESTIALLAGHSNPNFTRTRYVGAAVDAVDAAVQATKAEQ